MPGTPAFHGLVEGYYQTSFLNDYMPGTPAFHGLVQFIQIFARLLSTNQTMNWAFCSELSSKCFLGYFHFLLIVYKHLDGKIMRWREPVRNLNFQASQDLCQMLDNSASEELDWDDWDDYYPESNLDSSARESGARSRSTQTPNPSSGSREIGCGIQPGGDEPLINLANEQVEYWKQSR